jgi:two-component system response regulator HydG
VADDDDGVRATLAANLELEGYQVTEARDGGEAILLIGERAFDLVISDSTMPLATGVELLARLRKARLDTPFILISGFLPHDLLGQAFSDGLFALLDKPVQTERILAVVARALRRSTVLMVDDASASRLALALRAIGLRIEACADDDSALAYARHHAVDVCVLNLATQSVHGTRLCEELNALDPDVSIIAISEHATEASPRGERPSYAAWLPKAHSVLDLLRAIARVRAVPRP